MKPEEQREIAIQKIADMLRTTAFAFEFKVVKRPKGIKVIYEVTQEQMDEIIHNKKRNYETRRTEE